jgi:hypothetical protein
LRGRLIFPFSVELCQLDTAATEEDPDGESGPLVSGYDPIFREPIIIADPDAPGDTSGVVHRVEKAIRIPAQIETRAWDQLEQLFSGSNPKAAMELVFHYKDLERLKLVDENGRAKININDRLSAIYDVDGNIVREIPEEFGLYATEVRDSGFGFGRRRNLIIMTLQNRDKGAQQAS